MKTQKIKILYIHHGTGIGGAPRSLLYLINKLPKEKYEIKVSFLVEGVHEKMFMDAGINTEVIGCSNKYFSHPQTGRIQWYYFYRYFAILYHWINTAFNIAPKYLKNQSFDIIHLNSHALTSWAFAAHKLGKKVVMHNREAISHGYLGIRYTILKSLIKRNCDHVINISEDNKRRLGLKNKSSVVYNFVEIPNNYRMPLSNNSSKVKVLYLGGTAKIKGFETVVKCLPFINDNITIQIAGNISTTQKSKSLKTRVKYFVKKILNKTQGYVTNMMNSPKTEVLGLLHNPLKAIDECDILISPFKIEHFSRPAIEAFAYGKPVIGSNVEGMDEIIDHMENGILVEKNNPEKLAEAVNMLSNNKPLRKKLGKNAREKAIRVFSPEANMRKIEDLYQQLAMRKR